MAKTKDELKAIKLEYESLNNKLSELSEEELKEVVGGIDIPGLEHIGPYAFLSKSVNVNEVLTGKKND